MDASQLAAALDAALDTYTAAQCGDYYDQVLTFSDSTYEDNLLKLGYVDLDDPASINLYAASFEDKDVIEQAIADYNDSVDDLQQIQYTDYIGLMMSSITTIINAITYVLIAFVAVSLIVSSIMIGVITLISVQERTKEIGILRAIGASKRNVSSHVQRRNHHHRLCLRRPGCDYHRPAVHPHQCHPPQRHRHPDA